MTERLLPGPAAGRLPGSAFLGMMALWLTVEFACSSPSVVSQGTGGSGAGKIGGAGGQGGPSGTGGNILKTVAVADAGADRPTGGSCGDGILQASEQCDDANKTSGDGCSRLCQLEASWLCPTAGEPCQYVGGCGNGILTPNKSCDDGNQNSGDGCSSDCKTVEPGYLCRVPGKDCTPLCGDGLLKGYEVCDDGNGLSGDGCSSTCKIEPGYDCKGSPSVCKPTVCGNGVREAGEGCDDGNSLPLDGCTADCQREPKCGAFDAQGKPTSAVGACKSECGDGIVWRGFEDCDDGNQRDGDGCSHDCKVEPGFTCRNEYDSPPPKLDIPIIVRDFEWYQSGPPATGHPDFGTYCCDDNLTKGKGVLRSTLDADRKPVWAGPDPVPDPKQILFTGKAAFDQWYRDVKGVNMTFYEKLTLLQNATSKTTYAMNSDTDDPFYDRCGFFPLDSSKPLVDQNTGKEKTYTDDAFPGRTCHAYEGMGFGNSWANHNYAFTSELRYWFQYQGNEKLKFTGDDDVWVFINGTMAVEMPGTHNRSVGTVILDASKGTAQVGYGETPSSYTTVDFKLTLGNVYEVVVFQAERWCCGSNYMLTLANFLAGKTQCVPSCGDGVVVGDEECDCGNGSGPVPAGCPGPNSDTTYGGCTTQCKWGPFCGDGVVQGGASGFEACDQGKKNGDTSAKDPCSITCQKPRACGDGIVDTDLGEKCDLGVNNGVPLNRQLQPVDDPNDPSAQVLCTTDCVVPPQIIF